MNLKFMKALALLDRGRYDLAEVNIKSAISECNEIFEVIPMKACYAELLCESERYSEALSIAESILENSEAEENYDLISEFNTARYIKDYINSKKIKGDNTQ